VNFEDMLIHVLPSVRDCPRALALEHVVQAARTFCRKTRVWNYTLDTIDSVAGQAGYTLTVDSGQVLCGVLACEVNLQRYVVRKGSEARRLSRASRGNLCLFEPATAQITLTPAPWGDNLPIVVDVFVQPASDQSGEWPDEHEDEVTFIAAGALASLCALPGTTWKDVDTVVAQDAKFRDRINTVARATDRTLQREDTAASAVWF